MRESFYLLGCALLLFSPFTLFPIACSNNPTSPAATPTPIPKTPTTTFTPTSTPTNTGVVSTLAGSGTYGATNATGTSASFSFPLGVAIDTFGNVFVADSGSNLIRKISSGGVVTTLAGSGVYGSTNATGTAASFSNPSGVAVDTSGNVYVADQGSNLIRKITILGVVSTLAGQAGVTGATNATGTSASFNGPVGVAVDALGNVYVGDWGNHLIRVINPSGAVSTLAGSAGVTGATNATGTSATFYYPEGVAVDSLGNVYVADAYNYLIRKITFGGVVSTLAGSAGVTGATNATGTGASFNQPQGVAVDTSGNVYVADYRNSLIRKISAGGVVTTLAGSAGVTGATNATGTAASFNLPGGVAVDNYGHVYVADSNNNMIRKIQ